MVGDAETLASVHDVFVRPSPLYKGHRDVPALYAQSPTARTRGTFLMAVPDHTYSFHGLVWYDQRYFP